jgi:hypothetical protein
VQAFVSRPAHPSPSIKNSRSLVLAIGSCVLPRLHPLQRRNTLTAPRIEES